MKISLSVVMPAYNEEETVVVSINSVLKECSAMSDVLSAYEVIVIDDGSKDGTERLIRDHFQKHSHVRIFSKKRNEGKGACIAEGAGHARYFYTLIQDADLEYSPRDYRKLINPVLTHNADVVYGSRFKGEEARVLYFWHFMGNKFLTFLSNMFSNLNLTDMETCYKLIRTSIFQNLVLESKRFGIEPEITAKVAKISHIKIYEVPVNYHGRTYVEGKKICWKDGVAAIFHIIKFNLLRSKKNSFRKLK